MLVGFSLVVVVKYVLVVDFLLRDGLVFIGCSNCWLDNSVVYLALDTVWCELLRHGCCIVLNIRLLIAVAVYVCLVLLFWCLLTRLFYMVDCCLRLVLDMVVLKLWFWLLFVFI